MTIDRPQPRQIPGLRELWKEAFGDSDTWLDTFFALGFSPDRCRCITEEGRPTAALYWFDVTLEDRKLAYLYAIATAQDRRGRGLCSGLMADTHRHLKELGYAGAVLVPAEPSLSGFYGRMGYETVSGIRVFSCSAGSLPEPLRKLSAEEYARLRRQISPAGTVLQEGPLLDLLASQAEFFAGDGLLLTVQRDGSHAFCPEFLGDPEKAPKVLAALSLDSGTFRTPGSETPFAMAHFFSGNPVPIRYFAFALD